jgi:saccharopine dehydrogenase-like NADP-dependent oxidoreductase
MKVLALGCGDMGRMGISVLIPFPQITSITVADKNIALAKKYIELAGSNKLQATEIDVTNEGQLVELISNHDLVINTVGPFYKFGVPILEAVIKAKRNYIDICDDWKPTLKMLEMDNAAKAAGITAILGIGASPGVTNLMAAKACSKLDEVDTLITGWGIGSTKSGRAPKYFVSRKKLFEPSKEPRKASAAILHLIIESIGKIPTFRDGKLTEIEALTEVKSVKFPGGGRNMYACHVGHPEPVTLSRTLKANYISNVMYLTKLATNRVRGYIRKIEAGTMTENEVAIALERDLSRWWVVTYLMFWLIARLFKLPPELCAIAEGKKDNKSKRVAIGMKYRPYGEVEEGMDGITAIPLIVAALMLIDGKIPKKGVLTPEESIDPDEFFERYAKFCNEKFSAKDVLIEKMIDL